MENSWNPRRGYFNRVGFGKLQCFNCSSAAKSIWEFQMGKDICVWKSKIFVRFGFFWFLIVILLWYFPAKKSTLLFFLNYVFIWIIKCWGSCKSEKGDALISRVLKYYLSKKLSPNAQICIYLFLSCLASDDSLYFSCVFYPLKTCKKVVVFISHSCLL